MPSKFRIRYVFRPLVILIAKGLIKIGITPNIATILMLIFSILSCFSLIILQNLLIFAILVFITGILDGCDGAIARILGKTTKFGGVFDSTMDRISEFFIFMGLLVFLRNELLWNLIDVKLIIYISFLSSILISYCRARAAIFFKGDFDIGLMARSERLFYLFITMIVANFYGYTIELLFIFMWLVIGTFTYRMIRIYYMIKKRDNNAGG